MRGGRGVHPLFDGHAFEGMLLRSLMSAAYRNVLANNGVAPALSLEDTIGEAMYPDNNDIDIGKPLPDPTCTRSLLDRPVTLELQPESNGFELTEFLNVDIVKYAFVANYPGSNAYLEINCEINYAQWAYMTFYFHRDMGAVTVYAGRKKMARVLSFGDACRDDSFPSHYVDVKVPLPHEKYGSPMARKLQIETRVPECPDLRDATQVQLVSVSTAQQTELWETDVVKHMK